MQYQQDTPVAPRFDVNAPDLYIPGFIPPTSTQRPPPSGRACLGQTFRCPEAPMVLLLTSVCVSASHSHGFHHLRLGGWPGTGDPG